MAKATAMDARMEVEVGPCRCGGYGVVFTEEMQRQTGRCHDPDMDHRNAMQAMQDDIAETLRALGMSDHARPVSPHQVMQDEVIPEIRRQRALIAEMREVLARTETCIRRLTRGRYNWEQDWHDRPDMVRAKVVQLLDRTEGYGGEDE